MLCKEALQEITGLDTQLTLTYIESVLCYQSLR